MPQTILLDTVLWDLVLDINGNIAVASEPYSLAQDAASEIKTFLGELWYDTTVGIAYAAILGQIPSPAFLKAQMVRAAETVPDVTSAQVALNSYHNRVLTGQVQVMGPTAQTSVATFQVVTTQGTG